MSPGLVVEQIFNGLVSGAIYALMASGLSLIWGTLKMLNFAHGEFYMLGGFGVYFALLLGGLPPLVAVPVAMLGAAVVGMLLERLVIHPLLDKPGWDVSPIIATLGASILLQNLALHLWGERFKNIPYYIEGGVNLFGIRMAWQRVLIVAVTVVVIVVVVAALRRSRWGMALRATAQDRDAAVLAGIDVYAVYLWTLGLTAALAALAAAMLAPIYSINPWMGTALLLKAFIVCVLGGLGSLEGAILGGVLLGTTESLTVLLWSSEWKDVVAFVLLILVLWVRPAGLMGTREW
ncbi:MAG: branched-chain amino acid ABC transporter permease [Candidatus Rokubacteria bacterium]|nr:branched-chain amino acid ABC transporter permease [Candidatus Rokubacteria bacterium]